MIMLSENISFNMSPHMKQELDTICTAENKKLSYLLRELLLQGIRNRKINCVEYSVDDLGQ